MVVLKNIQLNNDVISALCLIEGKESDTFNIEVDSNNFNVIHNSQGFENTYSRMAVNKLRKTYLEDKKLPTELISVWC